MWKKERNELLQTQFGRKKVTPPLAAAAAEWERKGKQGGKRIKGELEKKGKQKMRKTRRKTRRKKKKEKKKRIFYTFSLSLFLRPECVAT